LEGVRATSQDSSDKDFRSTSLRGNKSFILIGAWNDLHGVLKDAVEGIRECDGKDRSQKINIQLEITLRIQAMDHQRAAAAVG
jgi:hypothetical protein